MYPQIDAAFRYMYDNRSKYTRLNGDIYEFGVYNGNSLYKICNYIKYNPQILCGEVCVYGVDSFEGLPAEESGMDVFDKFHEGSYKATKDDLTIEIVAQSIHKDTYIIKKWFSELNTEDMKTYGFKPALLVHIDCDLYISTRQALSFLMGHGLIVKNTLIAYDEFYSVENGGESLAHFEIFDTDQTKEVWHNTYYDKQTKTEIRQSLFEVL
jgi:hypothetical protein